MTDMQEKPEPNVRYLDEPHEYDHNSMLGHMGEDQVHLPLLWFNSLGQFWFWFIEWAIPGLGMFSEAYFIFSIGNVKQIIADEYPLCFTKYVTCGRVTTQASDYTQVIGIIFGMGLMGVVGDAIGRKWGSVTTACIMCVGGIMLTSLDGVTEKGLAIMYIVAQFVFGFGVGGEYPMAAGSAAERAEAGGKAKASKRGREVLLTFSMQGVGNFVNVAVIIILLVCFNQIKPGNARGRAGYGYSTTYIQAGKKMTLNYKYRPNALSGVWRISFGLGLIALVFLIYWRVFMLKESAVWKAQKATKTGKQGGSVTSHFGPLFKLYWHRLMATALGWFLWDFSFYGNKTFQSAFVAILTGNNGSLLTNLLWTLLNSGVALIGYWAAAYMIDDPYYGRKRMQLFGFIFVAACFFTAAGAYGPLTTSGGIQTFQFLYFFSSFWGQFGPNCTTFLLAGELYPTPVRTTAHGISAGFAKCGALWATVWFNYLPSQKRFWATATFNIAGAIITIIFLPDPMYVSLTELDRRFRYYLQGRNYHGPACAPSTLSVWEQMTGVGKYYDPAADEEDRMRDLMEENGGQHSKAAVSQQDVGVHQSGNLSSSSKV